MANPTELQLHAPAPAPIIEPIKPELVFRTPIFAFLSLNIFIGITNPDNEAIVTISEKSRLISEGMYNNRWGSKKTNPEIINSKTNSPANIKTAIAIYFLDSKTCFSVCLYKSVSSKTGLFLNLTYTQPNSFLTLSRNLAFIL